MERISRTGLGKEANTNSWSGIGFLKVAYIKGVNKMKFFGDAKMLLDWERKQMQIATPHLEHLVSTKCDLQNIFENIYFSHIFKELNEEVDD